MNHTLRPVKPRYRDSILQTPPFPPIDPRAMRAEVSLMCGDSTVQHSDDYIYVMRTYKH